MAFVACGMPLARAQLAEPASGASAPAVAASAAAPLFRYPYGNSTCETNARVRTLGYRIVGWHVDSCDWGYDGPSGLTAAEALSCGVLAAYRHDFVGHVVASVRAHRGGIVLMHETQRISVDNLQALITALKSEGYRFSTPGAPEFTASLR